MDKELWFGFKILAFATTITCTGAWLRLFIIFSLGLRVSAGEPNPFIAGLEAITAFVGIICLIAWFYFDLKKIMR